jgi:hypothetical protein
MKKTKLIPFSIEAWKAGGKPVTRDGREVKQLTKFEGVLTKIQSLMGVVEDKIQTWWDDGLWTSDEKNYPMNLMLEVEDTKKELYLVVISTPVARLLNNNVMAYNVYVSDNIEDAKTKENYLTHLKLPPCNS